MNSIERKERINALSNEEVRSILQALPNALKVPDLPLDKQEQIAAFNAVLAERGRQNELSVTSVPAVGSITNEGAREILLLLADAPMTADQQKIVDGLLDMPPQEGNNLIPLVAIPLIAGSLGVLYIVAHLNVSNADGSWKVTYDGAKETPLDKYLGNIISVFAKVAGVDVGTGAAPPGGTK